MCADQQRALMVLAEVLKCSRKKRCCLCETENLLPLLEHVSGCFWFMSRMNGWKISESDIRDFRWIHYGWMATWACWSVSLCSRHRFLWPQPYWVHNIRPGWTCMHVSQWRAINIHWQRVIKEEIWDVVFSRTFYYWTQCWRWSPVHSYESCSMVIWSQKSSTSQLWKYLDCWPSWLTFANCGFSRLSKCF